MRPPVPFTTGFVLSTVLFLTGIQAGELPHREIVNGTLTADGFLNAKLALWKQRLNLQAWSVSILLSSPTGLRPGTLGNIHWDAEKKTAVIRVLLPPGNPNPSPLVLSEMETTVVHELLHLELAALPKTDASRRDEEFAVDRLAGALLELSRGTPAH